MDCNICNRHGLVMVEVISTARYCNGAFPRLSGTWENWKDGFVQDRFSGTNLLRNASFFPITPHLFYF